MKNHTVTVGMLCLVALTTGACVMPSTYDEAVANLDATNAELNSIRTQSQTLTEQVSELQQRKVDLAKQMEETTSALQQAMQKMKAEHTASQERLNKLTRAINQLATQQNRLLYALQRANEEQFALQSTVERYQSKLGEVDGPRPSPQPIAPTNEQAEAALVPPSQVAAQTDPGSKPTVATSAAPADPTAVNPKPQPSNKQTSEPVEGDWLSMLKGWVIAFWQSLFS
jgi:uncharacterized phage infection (PIP) family protein YhgE